MVMNNTYINKFIDYLKYEKKLSDNTVSSYYNDLKNLYNYNKKYFVMGCLGGILVIWLMLRWFLNFIIG